MGHSYNANVYTSSKGLIVEGVHVNLTTSGAPSTIYQGGSGLISGVTKPTTGTYLFQMSVPYPPKLIACLPKITTQTTTTPGDGPRFECRYLAGSYSATLGQFTVQLSQDTSTSDVTQVAANGTSGDEIHVVLLLERYNTIAN